MFDMILEERFWSKVDTSGECWLWIGHRSSNGYGTIRPGGSAPSRGAHVVSWEMANGRPVADGMQVNHHCDERACVRPDHLYEGDQSQNMRDRVDRGRLVNPHGREAACPQGHPYEGYNLIERKRVMKNGRTSISRECRQCGRDAQRRHYQKKNYVP